MNAVNIIKFESSNYFRVLGTYAIKYSKDLMKVLENVGYKSVSYEISTPHKTDMTKDNVIFAPKLNGHGLLAGGTYINTVDNIFENDVFLYYGDLRIGEQRTVDGKFNFKYLNKNLSYDVKATPLNTDFNPRIVANIKPVDDNTCYKFLFYCNYDRVYVAGSDNIIKTMVYDSKGVLKFNIDNAPIGMTIDENTGVISFSLSTIGTYNFTVNCSDSLLELTKSIPMEIEIIA